MVITFTFTFTFTSGRSRDRDRSVRVSLFAALSTLSFAVLSYYMLDFLIQSYQAWSSISSPPAVPHLFTYFLLDQILPVSFAQNLFLLRMIFREEEEMEEEEEEEEEQPIPTAATLYPAAVSLQCAVALTYLGVVAAAPYSVATRYFFPVLFATRILLFAPYQALGPVQHKSPSEQVHPRRMGSLMKEYGRFFAPALVGGVLMQLAQTARTSSFASTLAALNCNPAVSALGYDVLIGLASVACFVSVELGTSGRAQAPESLWKRHVKTSSKAFMYLHAP
ncbi:hypothetical protein LTR34_002110 [Exophiala xenobiotica]|nr:hypothetical protein LTR34_002110 [Exophiala xenobiotica]KAK5520567.1 hypothetical protein LTR21_002259 [Exophiala xenobiotica]